MASSGIERNSSAVMSPEEFLSNLWKRLYNRLISLFVKPESRESSSICSCVRFESDAGERVNFRQFIKTLAIFRPETQIEAKLKFAFKIYDVNNEGFVTPNGLFKVMKMMVGNNLKDDQIREIADKTIKEADTDNDGKLSFEEFKVAVKDSGIESKLSIRF